MASFDLLPNELLYQICNDLDGPALINIARTYGRIQWVCSDILKNKVFDEISSTEMAILSLPDHGFTIYHDDNFDIIERFTTDTSSWLEEIFPDKVESNSYFSLNTDQEEDVISVYKLDNNQFKIFLKYLQNKDINLSNIEII